MLALFTYIDPTTAPGLHEQGPWRAVADAQGWPARPGDAFDITSLDYRVWVGAEQPSSSSEHSDNVAE